MKAVNGRIGVLLESSLWVSNETNRSLDLTSDFRLSPYFSLYLSIYRFQGFSLPCHPSFSHLSCLSSVGNSKAIALMEKNIFKGYVKISTFISSQDLSQFESIPLEVKCKTYFINCQEVGDLGGGMYMAILFIFLL